jgi:hypothetical protein
MPVLFIISVLQYAAVKYLPPGITEVPYFIILFINLLVTIRLLCIHDHTRFQRHGSSTLQADNHAFGFSFLEKAELLLKKHP